MDANSPPLDSQRTTLELGGAVKATTLHEQVKERIMKRIVLGDWTEGHVMPAEAELARLLDVSSGTIRRAMQDLVAQGVVTRRRRTGTIVTGRTPHHTLARYYRYYRLHTTAGVLITTTTRVVEAIHRAATQAEAESLRCNAGEPVCAMVRVREVEGRPVMIDRVVIPLAIAPDLPDEPGKAPTHLYTWLLQAHRVRLSAVREAVTARLATAQDCALLMLDPDTPHALLDIDETGFDQLNNPICLMRHAALTSDFHYVNEIR
ncbi:GntR family transcriptional regulator [Oceaniovalibus sp. ACAM 378]|uniref:GntR family transcriptional regulator n=1 Tax=Oceaniovalibus sp. ACAM 378 TaxID=2599923 RepID=UPI0011D4B4C1|nr:GntR family transcriptional regulator [Oceaniovalibus sp. ACAM 378]TYB85809.1 GntR family transcriptional regulator [Oceaniovalibus sp. ACAM 378]